MVIWGGERFGGDLWQMWQMWQFLRKRYDRYDGYDLRRRIEIAI